MTPDPVRRRVRDALEAAGAVDPGLAHARIEPLSRARARVDRVTFADGRGWVVRTGSRPDSDGPGPATSFRNAIAAAERELGPPVVVADVDRDVLVTELVPGRTLAESDLGSPRRLELIGSRLAELHARRTFANHVDPLHGLRAAPHPDEPPEVARVRRRVPILRAILGETRAVDVHGDLVPANLVEDGDRIWIVDWEYAGVGDPRLDVVYLAVTAGLDPDRARRVIDAWGSRLDRDAEAAARELIQGMLARWTALRG